MTELAELDAATLNELCMRMPDEELYSFAKSNIRFLRDCSPAINAKLTTTLYPPLVLDYGSLQQIVQTLERLIQSVNQIESDIQELAKVDVRYSGTKAFGVEVPGVVIWNQQSYPFANSMEFQRIFQMLTQMQQSAIEPYGRQRDEYNRRLQQIYEYLWNTEPELLLQIYIRLYSPAAYPLLHFLYGLRLRPRMEMELLLQPYFTKGEIENAYIQLAQSLARQRMLPPTRSSIEEMVRQLERATGEELQRLR